MRTILHIILITLDLGAVMWNPAQAKIRSFARRADFDESAFHQTQNGCNYASYNVSTALHALPWWLIFLKPKWIFFVQLPSLNFYYV